MPDLDNWLWELDGLSGENLLTRVLALLLRGLPKQHRSVVLSTLTHTEPLHSEAWNVRTEVRTTSPLGDGRIDMVIDHDGPTLGVEVKLDALFQQDQAHRYFAHFKRETGAECLAVLVPEARREEAQSHCQGEPGIKVVSWEELLGRLGALDASVALTPVLLQGLRKYYATYANPLAAMADCQDLSGTEENRKRFMAALSSIGRRAGLAWTPCNAVGKYNGCYVKSAVDTACAPAFVGFVHNQPGGPYDLRVGAQDGSPCDSEWPLVICSPAGWHCAEPGEAAQPLCCGPNGHAGIISHATPDAMIIGIATGREALAGKLTDAGWWQTQLRRYLVPRLPAGPLTGTAPASAPAW